MTFPRSSRRDASSEGGPHRVTHPIGSVRSKDVRRGCRSTTAVRAAGRTPNSDRSPSRFDGDVASPEPGSSGLPTDRPRTGNARRARAMRGPFAFPSRWFALPVQDCSAVTWLSSDGWPDEPCRHRGRLRARRSGSDVSHGARETPLRRSLRRSRRPRTPRRSSRS